ncbi:WYL domain-containing protein [Xanthobacter pseudotagetidis]|uniref:WYL domain-containing protein n=1 Tax=Xanthobacter pseudotagetidis TaxID=3119911 RepID=UPI003728F0A7
MNAISSLKTFFIDRVRAQAAPPYAGADRIGVPADDPHDELPGGPVEQKRDAADGQSFAIDYVDHAGHPSHRRISVWAVERNPEGVPILIAKCHERQATRAFRVDRITGVTDLDGARREPLARFFFETFGFVWPKEAIHVTLGDPEEARFERIRTIVRQAGLPLLAALSLADKEMNAAEVEEMSYFCDRACAEKGVDLSGAERERLSGYIARMRPTEQTVEAAIDTLMESGHDAISALLRAGLKVVSADGTLNVEEADMLDAFCFALTGRHVR